MVKTEWLDLHVEIKRESTGAYLVTDGEVECWLPKSQVRVLDLAGDLAELRIPEWLARNEGLI